MRILDHPNVIQLKHCFFSTTEKEELYLNLVLEFVSETVYRALKYYSRQHQHMPIIFIQLYTYQVSLVETLHYLLGLGFLFHVCWNLFIILDFITSVLYSRVAISFL